MSNTLKFGNGEWYGKEGTILAYNSENNNYKPLPFTFDRASSATRVNKDGLIETVGADQPRVDYLNDSKGALLLEPSRTNYVLYSETEGIIMGSNGWSGDSDSTITQNYGTTPFTGSELKSTRIQFTGFSKEFRNNFSSVTITPTASIWIKGSVGKTIKFGSNSNEGIFTLNGEWQKLVQTGSSLSTNRLTINTYSSTTARDIEIFAPQLEQGSYPTSIIKTQGSAVTRLADVCNNGGNEQVINSTEGTIYLDVEKKNGDTTKRRITINNNSSSIFVNIEHTVSNNIKAEVYDGSNVSGTITSSTLTQDNNKIAYTYKVNEFKLFINGVQVGSTVTSGGTISSGILKKLSLDNGNGFDVFKGKVKEIKLYNTALSDSELQALTT